MKGSSLQPRFLHCGKEKMGEEAAREGCPRHS